MPDEPVFLALGLLLVVGLLLLIALSPEARALARRYWPLAAGAVVGLVGLLWRRRSTPQVGNSPPARYGHLDPPSPPTVDEVKAQQGAVEVGAVAGEVVRVEELRRERDAAAEDDQAAVELLNDALDQVRKK